MENNSVNETWHTIVHMLHTFKEKHIPQYKRNIVSDVPWFNNTLKRLIKKRNNIFKRYKKSGQHYLKVKYICARNLVTKQIRVAKAKYESKIIKRSKNNRKIFYAYVGNKRGRSITSRIGPLENSKGMIVTDDQEVATLLNDYFASVFTKNEKKDELEFVPAANEELNFSANSNQVKKLEHFNITEEEVKKAIGHFKPNKSPGIDNITSTYALEIKDIIAKPLQILFNKSIELNEVPDDWKKANVTALYKKGEKSKAENYRPVSLTSLFGKAMEKNNQGTY